MSITLLTNKSKVARLLIRPYTLSTSSLRSLPNFMIVGAPKCGTTSLYKYLIQHPNVKPPLQKELNFFDLYFDRGIAWYRSNFPILRQDFITGEATPNYFSYPPAPPRIARLIPSVKLIILLRNPVDRACSLYHHRLRHSNIKNPLSFEEVIQKEPQKLSDEIKEIIYDEKNYDKKDYRYLHKKHGLYAYLHGSIYIDYIKYWLQFLLRKQLLILKSEDLYEDQRTTYGRVLEFLNLPKRDLKTYKKYNPNQYQKMKTSTRNYLIDYYKPHNQMLYEYLGQNFNWDQ